MPTPVTFDVAAGSLPVGWTGSPQDMLNEFADRLLITPSVPWSSFVLGAAEPTSDVGPWFKDGQIVYVWDDLLGAYKPQVIESISLQYIVSATDPGATNYTLWVDTTVGALRWSNGTTWTDTYVTRLDAIIAMFADYSTTVQMNTAIANAIAAIPPAVAGNSSFRATPSVIQNVVFGAPGTMAGTVTLGTETFDPDGVFTANKFTVPVGADGYYQLNAALNVTTTAGSPTDFNVSASIAINGASISPLNDVADSGSTNGQIVTGSDYLYLAAGQTVELKYSIFSDATVTAQLQPTFTNLSGHRVR